MVAAMLPYQGRIRMQNTKTNNTGFLRRVWGCYQQQIQRGDGAVLKGVSICVPPAAVVLVSASLHFPFDTHHFLKAMLFRTDT